MEKYEFSLPYESDRKKFYGVPDSFYESTRAAEEFDEILKRVLPSEMYSELRNRMVADFASEVSKGAKKFGSLDLWMESMGESLSPEDRHKFNRFYSMMKNFMGESGRQNSSEEAV